VVVGFGHGTVGGARGAEISEGCVEERNDTPAIANRDNIQRVSREATSQSLDQTAVARHTFILTP